MKNLTAKILTTLIITSVAGVPAFAESLFKTGVSQNIYPVTPRSLFSSVRAKSIGDLVTVVVSEQITYSDELDLALDKSSSTTDNFRTLINKLLPGKIVPEGISDYGGQNEVANTADMSRTTKLADVITAQVVQVLPNGNLLIQGKKTTITANEKMNIILSGIIDPRHIDSTGRINSSNVANLQMAVVGDGTVSRADGEGPVNKYIRYLF